MCRPLSQQLPVTQVLCNRWRHTHMNQTYLCFRTCCFLLHYTFFSQFAHLFAAKTTPLYELCLQGEYSFMILSSICLLHQPAYSASLSLAVITAICDPSLIWLIHIVRLDRVVRFHRPSWQDSAAASRGSCRHAASSVHYMFRLFLDALNWMMVESEPDTLGTWCVSITKTRDH